MADTLHGEFTTPQPNTHTFSPTNADPTTLPRIFCFANGASGMGWHGVIIAEDGEILGGHCSSNEMWLRHDLGIGEGSFYKSRREDFARKYPAGYVAEWVSYADAKHHPGLQAAFTARGERATNDPGPADTPDTTTPAEDVSNG
jgi:hypothetical protein